MFKNLFTISFLAGGLALAAPGMIFNCADDFQDVCDNMCWGAFCTQPTFGSVLNFDMFGGTGNENSNLTLARHKSAGCSPESNRCSKANLQCNEYPFASTSDADKGGQVSRCVTSKNMDRQRAIMMRYYVTACKEAPCEFIVGFGNPGAPGLKYCQAYNDPHGQCINDEANPIYKNGTPDVRPPVQKRSEPESVVHYGLFLMGVTQMKVLLPIDTPLNAKFVHPTARKNSGNAQGDSDAVIEIDIEIEWEFVEDFVAARLD